jgi:hypothetical protein
MEQYTLPFIRKIVHGEIRGNSFVGIDRLLLDFTDIKWV